MNTWVQILSTEFYKVFHKVIIYWEAFHHHITLIFLTFSAYCDYDLERQSGAENIYLIDLLMCDIILYPPPISTHLYFPGNITLKWRKRKGKVWNKLFEKIFYQLLQTLTLPPVRGRGGAYRSMFRIRMSYRNISYS